MSAVALLGLIAGADFPHGVVRRGAAMSSMRFDAVPLDHQDHPARVFDAREEFNFMGAGVIGLLQSLAEGLDIFIAFHRIDLLNDDFVNHGESTFSLQES